MAMAKLIPRQRTSAPPHRNNARPGPQPFGPRAAPSPALTNSGPPAIVPTTVTEFMTRLQAMRTALGLSYSQIAVRAGRGFGRSTAHRVLRDVDTLIELKHLKLYLKACKVNPAERDRWLRAWELLNEHTATAAVNQAATPDVVPGIREASSSPNGPASPDKDAPKGPSLQTAEATTSKAATATSDGAPQATPARRRPPMSLVRGVVALGALVIIASGATATMHAVGVPIEAMITTHGLVLVCVSAWVAVSRMAVNAQISREEGYQPVGTGGRGLVQGDSYELFFDPLPPAYPEVLGD